MIIPIPIPKDNIDIIPPEISEEIISSIPIILPITIVVILAFKIIKLIILIRKEREDKDYEKEN